MNREYIIEIMHAELIHGSPFNDPYLREEIVRCRDCKHHTYADAEHENNDWCSKHEHISWSVNGFCAWGERRDA